MNVEQIKAGQKWRFLSLPDIYSFQSDYSEKGPNNILDSKGEVYCQFRLSRPYKFNSQTVAITFFREGNLFNIERSYEVSFLLQNIHLNDYS